MAPGAHHMGTTRMHPDPSRGVVDEDCRVHGTSNLFVGGSSVFPTAGWAPPTLTIVALALRLADHLKATLGARERESVRLPSPASPQRNSHGRSHN
jgi:choline dehydrogenase-like flavoprotein